MDQILWDADQIFLLASIKSVTLYFILYFSNTSNSSSKDLAHEVHWLDRLQYLEIQKDPVGENGAVLDLFACYLVVLHVEAEACGDHPL